MRDDLIFLLKLSHEYISLKNNTNNNFIYFFFSLIFVLVNVGCSSLSNDAPNKNQAFSVYH